MTQNWEQPTETLEGGLPENKWLKLEHGSVEAFNPPAFRIDRYSPEQFLNFAQEVRFSWTLGSLKPTLRHMEVLFHILRGITEHKKLCERLSLKESTLLKHISSLYAIYGVSTKEQLVMQNWEVYSKYRLPTLD